MFEIIFFNFWTWLGTLVLVFTLGYSISLPFYWNAKSIEQQRLLEKEEALHRFYNARN